MCIDTYNNVIILETHPNYTIFTYLPRCIFESHEILSIFYSPPQPLEPRQPYGQISRMMDTLILDPFSPQPMGMSKMNGMSKSVNHLSSAGHRTNRPIGPVRPRQNLNALTQRPPRTPLHHHNSNPNNNGEDFIPSNPNTAGSGGCWRSETQRCEDSWKASLRKRDPDIQPTLPNIPQR